MKVIEVMSIRCQRRGRHPRLQSQRSEPWELGRQAWSLLVCRSWRKIWYINVNGEESILCAVMGL